MRSLRGAKSVSGDVAAEALVVRRRDPMRLRFAAALMVAASPATIARAQEAAQPAELPPLNVETTAKKKVVKQAPAKKAAPTSPAPQPPPQPVASEGPEVPPLPGQAGPVAPGEYKAEYSASNKMTGPLLNTPQTVTVIPGTVISERGSTTLTQALRNTPGITFDAGENGFSTSINNFKLRGMDTSGSIFTDGVRSSGSFARDMFNVEQVEVVKGAAADNGRGGAGGYVNIITKAPQDENFVRGEASLTFDEYGTDPLFRSTIDVNQRSGTVAVRANGMYENGGVMGRDVAEADAYGLAPSITFGVGTETRATFAYERLKRDDLPDWGVPGATVNGLDLFNPAAGRASRDNFYGLASDFDEIQGDRVVARIEHDFSNSVTITNQTVWERADRTSRFTVPTAYRIPNDDVTVQTQFYDRVNETFSNQTNLTARFMTGSIGHTVSTGVEVTRETSDALTFAGITCTGCVSIVDPDPYRVAGFPLTPTGSNGVDIDTVAGYLYDTVDLTKQWQLVGGIRVEHYKYEIEAKDLAGLPAGTFDGVKNSETSVSGKLGLVYKPVEDGTLYVSYGTSVVPPGSYLSNSDISRGADDSLPGFAPDADPVRVHNYEAGLKWDFFNGRFSTTAAVFRTEKHDVPHVTRRSDTIWLEEQSVQGIELGFAGNLTERWKAFGGMLWLDSERESSAAYNLEQCLDRPGDFGLTAGTPAAGCPNVTTDGDELAFTPNFSATLWMTYDITKEFTIGGGVQYVGQSWLGRPDDAFRVIKNGVPGELPSYFLVNVMASYDITENVALQFNIDNLFDEDYAVSTNWPGARATLGAPRTFRIGTSFDF